MATAGPADIILDTSTLINYLRIGRVDLLAGLPAYRFLVTDHVRHEVTTIYPAQLSNLEFAFLAGHLHVMSVDSTDPVFLEMKRQNLGDGESAAIAAACGLGAPLAMDDRRARNRGLAHNPGLLLMDTTSLQYMKEKVFAPGKTLPWDELTRHATGERLNPKAFAADFRDQSS